MNSLQRIFDAAWKAFIVGDNQPAYNIEERACSYLDSNFNKCAVGLCIPDGHPAQNDICGFGNLVGLYPELFPDLYEGFKSSQTSINDLNHFQNRLHDNHIIVSFDFKSVEWSNSNIDRLAIYLDVAKDYNLAVPIEQEYIVHSIYSNEECVVYYA